MSRVYCPRHPEHTVFYRVLFHYFEAFLLEKVIDKIIKHLNLTFKAARPPPPQAQLSMAAEEPSEYT